MVNCMQCVENGKNCFHWPNTDDILNYNETDILCDLDPPFPLNCRGDYKFSDKNFHKACGLMQK